MGGRDKVSSMLNDGFSKDEFIVRGYFTTYTHSASRSLVPHHQAEDRGLEPPRLLTPNRFPSGSLTIRLSSIARITSQGLTNIQLDIVWHFLLQVINCDFL